MFGQWVLIGLVDSSDLGPYVWVVWVLYGLVDSADVGPYVWVLFGLWLIRRMQNVWSMGVDRSGWGDSSADWSMIVYRSG